MDDYICGDAADATGPSYAHYKWHRNRGTDPCGKARHENGWAEAQHRVGHPLETYEPRYRDGYECGPAEDAEGPTTRHAQWHRKAGTPVCGKALAEDSWYVMEKDYGKGIDYTYGEGVMDGPTTVYQYTFLDGDRYYGRTGKKVERRWEEHEVADTPVGRKIRSGMAFVTEVLCVAPNRRMAMEIERMAIKSGNPWGKILNIIHNDGASQKAGIT